MCRDTFCHLVAWHIQQVRTDCTVWCHFFPPFAAAIKVEQENPATCEMWLVTRFLVVNAKNVFLAEIHGYIVKICSEGAVNEGIVRKWCWLFREGRTNVRDLE
jgi:hypothetical protein